MNIERPLGLPEAQEMVNRSMVVTSVDQGLQAGLKENDLRMLSNEVSLAVNEYNYYNPSEMLPKPAETIYNQLTRGLSCLIVVHDGIRWRFLHHGSVYPVFEQGEEQILHTQIVEFGSAITQKDFRKGFGLGTSGEKARLEIMQNLATPKVEVFGISTVKRLVTGHAWGKFGVNPISFWEHPYTSFLTDSCVGSSENFGHISCKFRRPIEESTTEIFSDLFAKTTDNRYLPCTLLATDADVARRFEERCKNLHQEFGGIPLTVNDISVNSYTRAKEFFDRVANLSKPK